MQKTLDFEVTSVTRHTEKLSDGSTRQVVSVDLDIPGEWERLREEIDKDSYPHEHSLTLRQEASDGLTIGQRFRVTIESIS